jgi:hypothetical protein
MMGRGIATRGLVFAVLLGAASIAGSQAVTVTGLLGYWRLDETAAPSADSSGNGNHATWTNAAASNQVPPAGPPGIGFTNPNCLSVNGSSAYVTASGFSWPTGGPVTVAFWNYAAAAQNSSAFTVGSQDGENRFHTHAPWSDGNLYWDYGNLNGNGRISTSYAAYLNTWTHVALVSEGNGGAFKAIYLNGALAASAASSNGPDVVLNGLDIGRWGGNYHNGRIDDFRIYNRVLTAGEIATLHQGQLPGTFTLTATDAVGQVDLSWTASSGAANYTITRTPTGGGATVSLGTQTGTAYSDTGGNPGTSYDYTVAASNVVGSRTQTATGTPLVAPPPPPRLNDHDEGLVGKSCSCGATDGVPAGTRIGWTLLALAAAAAAFRPTRGARRTCFGGADASRDPR